MTMSELTLVSVSLGGPSFVRTVACLLLHIINSMFLAACGPCFSSQSQTMETEKKNNTSRRVAEPPHKGTADEEEGVYIGNAQVFQHFDFDQGDG